MHDEKYRKVKAVQDDSCHWYIIPNDLLESFYADLRDLDQKWYTGDFDKKYGKYMTGGDLNLTQLFIKID